MSLEAISHRPSSSSSKEHLYPNEREASSRLAARLERSEYKRSRGKQRLHYHGSSGRTRRRDHHRERYSEDVKMDRSSRRDRRENDRLLREDPFHDGRQTANQFYRNFNYSISKNNARPQSWFGATPTTERNSKERPQSIHEISLDRDNEGSSKFPLGHSYPKMPYGHPHYKSLVRTELHRNKSRSDRNRQLELSQSLSSSFSSQVGSSPDEREENHGVYSAYDMTGRSPYGSLVIRRYSQSSLSSSSASWQQSSTSLSHHASKGQLGSGSLGSSSPDKLHGPGDVQRETVHKAVFIKRPPRIPEAVSTTSATFIATAEPHHSSNYRIRVNAVPRRSHNTPVHAQASAYSSGHVITKSVKSRSHGVDTVDSSAGDKPVIQSVTQVASASLQLSQNPRIPGDEQNVSPSVKDLAKRFSGNDGIFSEAFGELYENDYRETRRVKAETWPRFVCLQPGQGHSDHVMNDEVFDEPPPKPPYPQGVVEDFGVVRTRAESNPQGSDSNVALRTPQISHHFGMESQLGVHGQNASDLASHRLSLQELIKLHEDQIAKHAKSAQATVHAQIYLKRPEFKGWNFAGAQRSPQESKKDEKWHFAEEASGWTGAVEGPNRSAENRTPVVAHYELTELKSAKGTPIKVVEVTETGTSYEPRERPTVKAKRHRTIGVVGFRHQIDRVSEGQTENKPKRHTAIGIVSVKAVATTTRQLTKEEPVVVSHAGFAAHASAERSIESLNSSLSREQHNACQETPLNENDRRISKRTCKEFDFQVDAARRGDFPEDFVEEEVLQREEALPQFVRPSGVVQVSPGSEHDGEMETAMTLENTQNSEAVMRIVVPSPENSSKPSDAVDSKPGNFPFHRSDDRTWSIPISSRSYNYAKPYSAVSKSVPVAQVLPVSPLAEPTPRTSLTKESLSDSSPFSRSQSAREMYETRLALWNLYPLDTGSRNRSQANSSTIPRQPTDPERHRSSSFKASELAEQTKIHQGDAKGESRLRTRDDMEDYYLSCIEKLQTENKELIAKYESEKRELRQKYEEQRKVANAYQKLEDRYRRRVHELQEALAGCTCQSSFVRQNKINQDSSVRSDKDGDRSTTASSISGVKIMGDLEDWLSEQSKDTSVSKKINTASRNSLLSSSSDMTGAAWDELYDLLGGTGELDYENGTHV